MDRWVGKIALVTGASSGIGKSISEALVKKGVNVVATARNIERLNKLAEKANAESKTSAKITPSKCDLRVKEEIFKLFEFIKSTFGRLDICINNAGLLYPASILKGSYEQWQEMLDVNITALAICCRESVKMMMENNIEGQIINMNSMAGHNITPFSEFHYYSGTKFMVRSLTDSLKSELHAMKSPIKVANLSPGLTRTEILTRGLGRPYVVSPLEEKIAIKPEDVAQLVISILKMPLRANVNDILVTPNA